VVHGGSLSKDEWAQVRRAEAIKPAGQVTPSRQVRTSPDGTPPISDSKWTPGMRTVAEYARSLAVELLGFPVLVEFHSSRQYFAAAYGGQTLMFNLMRLGHRWFDSPDQEKVDALLIHEFAHAKVSDHLSEDFHDEVCRLGARLRNVEVRLPG
jgi:hypothetical protein